MIDSVQNKIYFNEVMTPKQKSDDIDKDLEKFATKYEATLDKDFVICITDNPMGLLSFEAFETIEVTEMPIKPERLLIHLNAFHRKDDFDRILKTMVDNGVKNILAISGDGDERLHRLAPEELGYDVNCITSVELIKYIKREYPDFFRFGVAYNHYEPAESEREKMKRKIEAGAEFIITQPVIRKHENIDWLKSVGIPVVIEAWMSKRIDLVAECVGYELSEEELNYDPIDNFNALRENYPDFGIYFAFLGLKKQILKLNL